MHKAKGTRGKGEEGGSTAAQPAEGVDLVDSKAVLSLSVGER